MPFDVKLPDIGEGVAEGEIVRWLVKPGEAVKEDQPLVEVMTDKANVEIPSPRTGTIAAIHVTEGSVVPVGTVLISIDVAGDGDGAPATPSHGAATKARPPAAPDATGDPARPPAGTATVQATPAVRQLAKQLGVNLEEVTATGPGGRITNEDVQRAANKGAQKPGAAAGDPGRSGARAGAPHPPATGPRDDRDPRSPRLSGSAPSAAATGAEQRIPLRGLRRRIAETMRRSLDTAAHFTFVAECDMGAIAADLRKRRDDAGEAGAALTYLAYVVKALVEPLRKYPLLNASLDDAAQEIVLKRELHIGIATATEQGLTVPVIRDVDRRPLLAIAREIKRLAQAAREGTIQLDALQGATFTVTSTGAKGGLLATPIIHHPQVAILGLHEVKKRPVVVDDAIVARETTHLSISLDHRVVDGVVGAEFLYDVVARLAAPGAWLDEGDLA